MVRVRGSTGKVVDIQVLGIAEVHRRIRKAGMDIKEGEDLGVVKAGGFVEEELKESIMGHRDEPRSVMTGLFANSIEFIKLRDGEGIVKPISKSYPNSNMTTDKVAAILEGKRKHFENTKSRTKDEVKDIIQDAIKRAL